jgi:hypothetical protein
MTVQLTAKKRSNHFIPNFEMHSLLLFAALAIAAATAAQGQTGAAAPAKPNSSSGQMAASGTAGMIPPSKATSKDLEAAFNRADANRDGQLSRQEAEHFPALAHRFEQIDTDHDSTLSRDEFNQAAGS